MSNKDISLGYNINLFFVRVYSYHLLGRKERFVVALQNPFWNIGDVFMKSRWFVSWEV